MSIHSRGRSFDETSTKLRRLSYSQKWNFDQTSTKLRQVFGIDLQCFESVFGQLFVIHALWNCQSNSFFVAVSHLSERCALERYFETDTRERSFWEIYLWEILESYFYERYLRLTFERDMFEEVLRHSWAYVMWCFFFWEILETDFWEMCLKRPWEILEWAHDLSSKPWERVWETLRDCFGMYVDFAIEVFAIDVFLSICDILCVTQT